VHCGVQLPEMLSPVAVRSVYCRTVDLYRLVPVHIQLVRCSLSVVSRCDYLSSLALFYVIWETQAYVFVSCITSVHSWSLLAMSFSCAGNDRPYLH